MEENDEDNNEIPKNSVKNESQNPEQEEVEKEEVKMKVENFDYLTPLDGDSVSFDFNINNNVSSEEINVFKEDNEQYKYVFCILLKDNSNYHCTLLENTLKGIIAQNLGDLSTLHIAPKNIKIFIFINQISINENESMYLVNKTSLQKIDENKKYLKIPQKIKDELREIKIDVICKKHYMTEIESLQCYYTYILPNYKRPIISSVITAGVVPEKDSLKKLIQISFDSNQENNSGKYSVAVPALEVNEGNSIFLKIVQYDRIHYNIYDMNFYSGTAAAPISSLFNTMIIDESLLNKLKEYYKDIYLNATIDYHDYNLALCLYKNLYTTKYYSKETLGKIIYCNNFDIWDYKDSWVNKSSGYYGNFFEICRTFLKCNDLPMIQKIFMFFQIIGLLIEFFYPSLSILVIYSVFYEAFCTSDILPAAFLTLIYIMLYLGSGACSMISKTSEKMKYINKCFFFFMEVYYLFI